MRQILLAMLLVPILGWGVTIPSPAQEKSVLSRLEMRDYNVIIEASADEILYTISTKDGKILDAQLNQAELQAKHPQIYENIQPAIASPDSMLMMLHDKQF